MRHPLSFAVITLSMVANVRHVEAAGPPDSKELIDEQRRAMMPLAIFDGTWRGPATATLAEGRRVELTQTERVGGFLGGSLKLIEGKGFAADGSVVFNAFGPKGAKGPLERPLDEGVSCHCASRRQAGWLRCPKRRARVPFAVFALIPSAMFQVAQL